MWEKIKYCFLGFIFIFGFNLFAVTNSTTSTINGNAQFNNQQYNSLEVNGHLTFSNLVILDTLIANGSIKGKNLECKFIEANGSFNVDGVKAKNVKSSGSFTAKNIEVAGMSEFYGALEIRNGKLRECQISSEFSNLIDSEVVGNIYIKKVTTGWSFLGLRANEVSIQVLELNGKSLVMGDIAFEGIGEIHIFGEAKVTGKIVNAKVIKK